MRIKSLAQEHNAMFPARAQTQTAGSGNERTKHEVTNGVFLTRGMLTCDQAFFLKGEGKK